MSKYDVLGNFLKQQSAQRLPMNFSEVEKVLGFKLPASAHEYPAWWANEHTSHVQARAWMTAGFETEQVDLATKKLVFKRVLHTQTQPPKSFHTIGAAIGMSEESRDFLPANAGKKRVHPLIGWMKGTFTIEPGYDLTRPTMDDDELAEMEANLDRTADMIEQGMSKKR
ncbi:MAG TPA: hypothetical protein VII56_15320 [Rhizomicrobium sp.]